MLGAFSPGCFDSSSDLMAFTGLEPDTASAAVMDATQTRPISAPPEAAPLPFDRRRWQRTRFGRKA